MTKKKEFDNISIQTKQMFAPMQFQNESKKNVLDIQRATSPFVSFSHSCHRDWLIEKLSTIDRSYVQKNWVICLFSFFLHPLHSKRIVYSLLNKEKERINILIDYLDFRSFSFIKVKTTPQIDW